MSVARIDSHAGRYPPSLLRCLFHQHAVTAQHVLQLVVRQCRNGPIVRARHGAGGDERIDD
jgi:hypothetical protein